MRKKLKWIIIGGLSLYIILLIFRTFFYHNFRMPSPSMIPTLPVEQHMAVSKFAYGYSRYSFPFDLNLFEGRIFATSPKRGDLIVFRSPRNISEPWIKRVIGLPKDSIQFVNGRLYLNGQETKLELLEEVYKWEDQNGKYTSKLYEQSLPNGIKYKVIKTVEFGDSPYDNTPEYLVPDGHYFVIGDNLDFSDDSRRGGFFVPFENLIGRVDFLY